MAPVTRVNDPCLIALFKQLPPTDQLTASKVCRRWADLVTYAARSTRSLAILVGENSMDKFEALLNKDALGPIKLVSLLKKNDGSPIFPQSQINQWNSLHYRGGLDEVTVEAIVDTFVNLNTLQIGFYYASTTQLDFIAYLLELWSHQLTSLKVHEHSYLYSHSPNRLFVAINGLSILKHLHLYLESLPYRDLPVISKLEHLRIYWGKMNPHKFVAMLRQHATASLCTIEYLCEYPNYSLAHFTSLDEHLLARFTRFDSRWSQLTKPELITAHFRQLTSLEIEPPTTTLRHLFGHLSQLTQLLYLCLTINFAAIRPDDQYHLLLPQLNSVKALRLADLNIRSHRELEQLKLSWTMPNLEVIDFAFYFTAKCIYCCNIMEDFCASHMQANLSTFKHCFRQMFAPLKANCTQLRAILHNHEAILGSAEELLAE